MFIEQTLYIINKTKTLILHSDPTGKIFATYFNTFPVTLLSFFVRVDRSCTISLDLVSWLSLHLSTCLHFICQYNHECIFFRNLCTQTAQLVYIYLLSLFTIKARVFVYCTMTLLCYVCMHCTHIQESPKLIHSIVMDAVTVTWKSLFLSGTRRAPTSSTAETDPKSH